MPHRILIAATVPGDCAQLQAQLTGLNCDLETAVDVSDMLAKATEFMPDVLVLDAQKQLDGWEICQHLKTAPATPQIRILTILSRPTLSDIERAVASGTDDVISKPIDGVELNRRGQLLLELAPPS